MINTVSKFELKIIIRNLVYILNQKNKNYEIFLNYYFAFSEYKFKI